MSKGDPKPRQTPKAATARREILATAARMMRAGGYADMSLRDLAAEVGMKAGSLYYHFPSKDALATEVMARGVEVVAEAVREQLADHPNLSADQRLVLAMRVHLDTLLSASDFSSAHIRCYPFVPDAVREELTLVRRDYDRVWTDVVRDHLGEGASDRDVHHLRLAIIGALNWSLEWFDPDRDSVDAFVTSVAQHFVRLAE